jgi:hypothetical protein
MLLKGVEGFRETHQQTWLGRSAREDESDRLARARTELISTRYCMQWLDIWCEILEVFYWGFD